MVVRRYCTRSQVGKDEREKTSNRRNDVWKCPVARENRIHSLWSDFLLYCVTKTIAVNVTKALLVTKSLGHFWSLSYSTHTPPFLNETTFPWLQVHSTLIVFLLLLQLFPCRLFFTYSISKQRVPLASALRPSPQPTLQSEPLQSQPSHDFHNLSIQTMSTPLSPAKTSSMSSKSINSPVFLFHSTMYLLLLQSTFLSCNSSLFCGL